MATTARNTGASTNALRATEETERVACWKLTPKSSHVLGANLVGFICMPLNDTKRGTISFSLSFECTYPNKYRSSLASIGENLRKANPSGITNLMVSIDIPAFALSSPLQYLNLLSTFATVARHNYSSKEAREFLRRFKETFMVVEVIKIETNDGGEEEGDEMVAFTVVHVADEEGLSNMLTTPSTPLQFVTLGGGGGGGVGSKCLLPADSVVFRVSLPDIETERWIVLTEKYFRKKGSTELRINTEMEHYARHCRFAFLRQHVEFVLCCPAGSVRAPATLQVVPTVIVDHADLNQERKADLGSSALAWWRFLDICLTGVSAEEEAAYCLVSHGLLRYEFVVPSLFYGFPRFDDTYVCSRLREMYRAKGFHVTGDGPKTVITWKDGRTDAPPPPPPKPKAKAGSILVE